MTRLAVLGASGAVGRELTARALDRGDEVVAISRHPDRLALPDSPRLTRVAADVTDPADEPAITIALRDADVVVSTLGVSPGEPPGVLTAGARAIAAAEPSRVVSVGAFGTGPSARAAGLLTRTLLRLFMRAELPDKVAADATILGLGGTVIHAGPMKAGPVSPTRRAVPVDQAPSRLFPASVTHGTVAAAMLDAADAGPRGQALIALDR